MADYYDGDGRWGYGPRRRKPEPRALNDERSFKQAIFDESISADEMRRAMTAPVRRRQRSRDFGPQAEDARVYNERAAIETNRPRVGLQPVQRGFSEAPVDEDWDDLED